MRLFRQTTKKTPRPCITDLFGRESTGRRCFTSQRASNPESASSWRRHHGFSLVPAVPTFYWHLKHVNTLRPRQHCHHFADDNFKCIFFKENVSIWLKISLKFVPRGPINDIPALFQIMAWRRPGDKPLSGPMMVSLLTHICVTRPQWVDELRVNTCVKCQLMKFFCL